MKKVIFVIVAAGLIAVYMYMPLYCSADHVINRYVEMVQSSMSENVKNNSSTYCIVQTQDDIPESYYTWLKLSGGYIGFISEEKVFIFSGNDFDGVGKTHQRKLYNQATSYKHSGLNALLREYGVVVF